MQDIVYSRALFCALTTVCYTEILPFVGFHLRATGRSAFGEEGGDQRCDIDGKAP